MYRVISKLEGGGEPAKPSRGISDAIELFCEPRDEREPVDLLTMSEVDTKRDREPGLAK